MSLTVKLIIELPTDKYLSVKTNMINDFIYDAVKHGIPLDDVPSVENKGEWIPVSERLPESGKEVLFCDIDDDIRLGYHIEGCPRTHFTEYGSWEFMKNVVAWQPLPEPYKEGE